MNAIKKAFHDNKSFIAGGLTALTAVAVTGVVLIAYEKIRRSA